MKRALPAIRTYGSCLSPAVSLLALCLIAGSLRAQDGRSSSGDSLRRDSVAADSIGQDSAEADTLVDALHLIKLRTVPDRAEIVRLGLRPDSSDVVPDSALGRAIGKYRSDPAFDYERRHEGLSWWQRFLRWLDDLLSGSPGDGGRESSPFLDVLGWIALAIVVCVIVVVVMGVRRSFLRPARRLVTGMQEVEEDIHEMDFDALIARTIAEGDYRRAVRLLYLNALKRMTDRGLIQWKLDKTNHEYLRELRNSTVIEPFRRATLVFEYVWYGDISVDETNFSKIRDVFVRLDRSLAGIPVSSVAVGT